MAIGIILAITNLVLGLREIDQRYKTRIAEIDAAMIKLKNRQRHWERYRQARRDYRADRREHRRSVSQNRDDISRLQNPRRHGG